MRPAEEALQRALADFGAAAAAVEDVGEVADAWALLAAVQYGAGQDETAAESLARALALAPGRALPLAATSPLFAREVERVRQAVLSGPPGRLVVESTPAGAAVVVDGVPYGAAPVLVRDVPTGTHLWRVQLPSGEWVGGAVEVAAGREVRVVGAPVGGTPASRLVALLARNRVDAELVRAAREHAQAERADAVFLGAVRREGRQLALEVFLLEATSGELRRLPRATFDEDLLSASQQFLRLAGEYVRAGTLGEPVRLPVAVTAATLPAPARAERRFARGPAPDAPGSRTRPAGLDTEERAGEPRQEPGTRAPLRRPPPKKD